MEVRPLLDEERQWMIEELTARWGGSYLVARGEAISFEKLDVLLATTPARTEGQPTGQPRGLLGYRVERESLEIVSLDSFEPGLGVGGALVQAAIALAMHGNLRRVWLVTTNDNVRAISLYLREGLSLVAVHSNAVAWSREVKPEIPLANEAGVSITDELEFELLLDAVGPPSRN